MKALKSVEMHKNWDIIWSSEPLCFWNCKTKEVELKFVIKLIKHKKKNQIRTRILMRNLKTKQLYFTPMLSLKLNKEILKTYEKHKKVAKK